MPEIFQYRYTVRSEDIDAIGHANNVAYIEWMQSAAVAHSAAQGWPGEEYHRLGSGWVVRSHQIKYVQPALDQDAIVVQTWVATMKKVTSLRRYQIMRANDEALLATAETNWAFIDYSTGQPRRIPPEVARAFQVVDC